MKEAWIMKYAPKKAADVLQAEVGKLKDYILNHKIAKKKGLLLYGPPGSGKTTAVNAIAQELGLELVETNASDFRTKNKLDGLLGGAIAQQSLFYRGKIILMDEVDGLSGTKDRGGIPEMIKLMEKSAYPVVFTANDPWNKKFSGLRKKTRLVEFGYLEASQVTEALRRICETEELQYEESTLKTIARRTGGDLRGAINDLQSITSKNIVNATLLEGTGDRGHREDIKQALLKIYKTNNAAIALRSLDNVNEDYDKVLLWLDENLPKEYTNPEDLAAAYDCLSKANIYKNRIMRRQHWRYLVYVNAMLTAGVATAKKEKNKNPVTYVESKRILKIWMANQKNFKKKAIAEKLSEDLHTSSYKIKQDVIPYLQHMYKHHYRLDLDLDKEQEEWLRK